MKPAPKLRARRLRFEALEQRRVLATGVTAALNAGVLNVTGTDAADSILFQQYSGQISINGVSGSWPTTQVKSIAVSLLSGDDYVSLDSKSNGGNQPLQILTLLSSGDGHEHLRLANARDVYFGGLGNQLQVASNGNVSFNGVAWNWTNKIVVNLNSGVLRVAGTNAADAITFQQSADKITVQAAGVSWSAATTQIQSIVVDLQDGNDSVSLDSLANGGTQVLQTAFTIYSGNGSQDVHLASGNDELLNGTGHTLQVSSTDTATLDGQVLNWLAPVVSPLASPAPTANLAPLPSFTQSTTPTPPPPPTNWFTANVHDTGLETVGAQEFQDGLIDRNDMITLFRTVEQEGPVTSTQMSDLELIVNTTSLFGGLDYVQKLSSCIVLGNSANANYQGSPLGNLAVGSSAVQLEDLVDKWFLGADHPSTPYAYSPAAGQLFVNGPAYTDVNQGLVSDCAFIASLAETALRDPTAITSMFIVNGDGTYTVRFYSSGAAEYVTVDSQLPTSGGAFVYDLYGRSSSDPTNVLWSALAEKAYAQIKETSWFGSAGNNYNSVAYQYAYTTLGNITGQSTVAFTYPTSSTALTSFANAYNSGKLICMISLSSPPSVVGNHCYAVVGYDPTTETVTLFNPWGIGYGLVTLTWSQIQANFSYFDRTA